MNKPRVILRLSAGALAAGTGVLLSCTLGPDYSRPSVEVPASYKSASTMPSTSTQAAASLSAHWWTLFNDPMLTQLEEDALKGNFDLKAAAERITEARAAAKQVKSQYYPQITFNPNLTAAFRPNIAPTTVTEIPFDLGYELDIWGQVKRSLEAADANTRATAAQYAVVEQTLAADVAQDYINLRALEDEDRILQKNVEATQAELDLTQRKKLAGLAANIDIAQAQTLHDELVTQQVDIHRQRTDTEHALAILIGKPPAEFSVPAGVSLVPPVIPAEIPAAILRHRPDVVAAEENLIAANADVGVALTNFYPSVTLTGTAGLESLSAEHILDWQSALLSIGPSISMPIFEGGKLEGALEQAKARYRELVATYRSTILAAFSDVEVSLNDVNMFSEGLDAQHRAVDSARETYRLSNVEFQQGLVSSLQLIEANRTLLSDELTESQITNQRLVSTVLLIKALGSGWTPETTHPNTPK